MNEKTFIHNMYCHAFLAFTVCILILMSQAPIVVKIISVLCIIKTMSEINNAIKVYDQVKERDKEKQSTKKL